MARVSVSLPAAVPGNLFRGPCASPPPTPLEMKNVLIFSVKKMYAKI